MSIDRLKAFLGHDVFLGVAVYVFLFFSIFKVYYTSPLVTGIDLVSYRVKEKSDLVFLIVADGLRPDKFYPKFFESFKNESFPNLNIGYSHTRVPTESRPGHLALLGGFYEDVSAVTKGWKSNPIEFDSIFNHTCRGFAWGGPDVVPYFRPYSVRDQFFEFYFDDRIRIEAFPETMLDMGDADVTGVDKWTFDKFHDYFSANWHDFMEANCTDQPNKLGRLIFLHLNAADQVGHNWKPESEQYVQVVDYLNKFIKDLKEFMEPFEEKFKVSYVFTSDHGMTDWGSHGGGSDAETRTALMTWGHGIRKVKEREVALEQADICPLLAALIGCNLPTNSVGKLPIDLLDLSDEDKFENLKIDTLHILNQVAFKHDEQKSTHIYFQEYPQLNLATARNSFKSITKTSKDSLEAIESLRNSLISAKDYYHKYDRGYETFLVVSMYGLLMVNFIKNLIGDESPKNISKHSAGSNSLKAFIFLHLLNVLQGLMISSKHILFHFVLITMSYRTLTTQGLTFSHIRKIFFNSHLPSYIVNILIIEFSIFSFHTRFFLSIPLIIMSSISLVIMQNNIPIIKSYLITNLGLALFPQFPIIGQMKMKPVMVAMSGFASIGPTLIIKNLKESFKKIRALVVILACGAGILLMFPQYHNPVIFATSWLLTIIPFPMYLWYLRANPTSNKDGTIKAIYGYALIFSIPLHLMSLGYEGLFYWTLVTNLLAWIKNEELRLEEKSSRKYDQVETIHESTHVAVYHMFYVIIAFFGTGNIASINGFDPVSTHCYTTTLVPSIMGALMIYKMICPIILVSLVFSLRKNMFLNNQQENLQKNHNAKYFNTINMISFIISVVMSAHFFCWLLDTGSWADIGISISHYVISMAMGLLSTILLIIGDVLLFS